MGSKDLSDVPGGSLSKATATSFVDDAAATLDVTATDSGGSMDFLDDALDGWDLCPMELEDDLWSSDSSCTGSSFLLAWDLVVAPEGLFLGGAFWMFPRPLILGVLLVLSFFFLVMMSNRYSLRSSRSNG